MKNQFKIIAFLLLVSFVFLSKTKAQSKPNVLWIVTDDQRMDSNSYYNEIVSGKKESPLGYVESPNLDALAKEGTVFTNFYCNSPACAPSRGSMITGKYPHHSGIYGFEKTHNQTDFFNKTMPQVMAEQGYQTAMFGKKGYYIFNWEPKAIRGETNFYEQYVNSTELRGNKNTTDWDNSTEWGKVNGKYTKLDSRVNFYYPNGVHKSFSRVKELTAEEKKTKAEVEEELDILYAYTRSNPDLIIGGVNSMPADKTLDGNITREFLAYLNNTNKNYFSPVGKQMKGVVTSKPFFTSLSYHFPHTPVMPPKEFRDRFAGKIYAIPEFDKKELKKLPAQLKKLYDKMKTDAMTYEEKQQAIRDYYAFCAFGDSQIGKAIQAFKDYSKKNKQEYLILYVCGDHGWQLGEQGIEAKFSPWELSNHTTAIVVSSEEKKFKAGKVFTGFAEYVDIMPTVLAAGGADLSKQEFEYLDGYDLAEVLTDKKLTRDYVLGEFNHVVGPRAFLRTKDFSFSMRNRKSNAKASNKQRPNIDVKWGLDAPRAHVEMALYDLRVDPMERNNVANDTEYKELADWFRKKLGNITLGDGRIESNWVKKNDYNRSDFAKGADDKKIEIPKKILPKI
ncbi:sulfatase-like hydrolase/transferase [Flavicella sediminum]|uniref:sulfatase-like hydrolase/transferase n=1 Tax=Flavicella sediminum TaxID=2585141 RepID=UPI0011229B10|nr:sulfatase-like hydrolase/transferase [Flavicella sediminum]